MGRARRPAANGSSPGWQGRFRRSESDGAFRALLGFNLLLFVATPQAMEDETDHERGDDTERHRDEQSTIHNRRLIGRSDDAV